MPIMLIKDPPRKHKPDKGHSGGMCRLGQAVGAAILLYLAAWPVLGLVG